MGTLRVGHLDVSVIPWSDRDADCSEANGLYHAASDTIFIRESLSPIEQARVLLHEVFHCIWTTWGMDDMAIPSEESVCHRFSLGLTSVLRSNPSLVHLLSEALYDGKGFVR